MEALSSDQTEPSVAGNSYEGLSGRNILKLMTHDSVEGIKRASPLQARYAKRVCLAAGVEYPSGLLEMNEDDVDEMMLSRLTSGATSDKM